MQICNIITLSIGLFEASMHSYPFYWLCNIKKNIQKRAAQIYVTARFSIYYLQLFQNTKL